MVSLKYKKSMEFAILKENINNILIEFKLRITLILLIFFKKLTAKNTPQQTIFPII